MSKIEKNEGGSEGLIRKKGGKNEKADLCSNDRGERDGGG